jgi:hypothetical protein
VSIDVADLGDLVPGAGPDDKLGPAIVVPVGTVAASATVVNFAHILVGWSFRESTGLGNAVAELIDGGDDNGALVACLSLSPAFDPAAAQTPADNTATGANAAIAATIGGGAGTLVFVQSLRIEGLGATAAAEVQATLTGVLGGTITYPVSVPAGVAVPIAPVVDSFPGRGLQAAATGTAITLNLPAFGAGNTFAEVELQGYIQTAAEVSDTQRLADTGLLITSGLRVRVISGSVRGTVWIRR